MKPASNEPKGFTTFMRTERGFTLIELLVVISVIAVLSVIGVAVYSGIQQRARDSKRKADINTIANTLEANKNMMRGYQHLDDIQFSSGKIPYDPLATSVNVGDKTGCGDSSSSTSNKCWYCIKPAGSSVGYCDTTNDYSLGGGVNGDGTFNGDWSIFNPPDSLSKTISKWIVCANLESGSPAYFCRKSTQ
ncbi:type II secretion system GspH family protein [Patescibacteria group bacterium]|nr:type II secretion system GspH family protein [Patescibacteria group bacterium]